MVLRKPPPPRLENLNKWHARSEPRSPSSPSTSSPSSQRRARLNRVPSQESVYSPDLNTSPAFDLMPLEEAQRSPVGSATSQPPSSWPDDLGERSLVDRPGTGGTHAGTDHQAQWVPPALMPDPQRTEAAGNGWQNIPAHHDEGTGEVPVQLQSNNPFLKPKPDNPGPNLADQNEWNDRYSHATTSSAPLSQTEGYIPMTARLSLLDNPEQQDPWKDEESQFGARDQAGLEQSYETLLRGSQHSIKVSAPQEIYLQGGQANPYAPAVVVQPSNAQPEDAHGLQPSHAQTRLGSDAGVHTPSAISSGTSATSHELIDLDAPDTLAVESGSHRASSSVYSSEAQTKGEEIFSDDAALQVPPLLPASAGSSEQRSPGSSSTLSPAEATRQKEQRAETYSIRRINWTDRTGQLLQSPILVQNQNGPCPLLALINALVLRADPKTQPPIIRALRTREQISLGLLIEALFEELTTCLGPDEEFPDIEALTQFLTMLHTGMNVNPCLVLETTNAVGTFLQTADIRLYSTFGVPLIHGWLASWSSPEHAALNRIAKYHEDIQLLPFRKQELEDRVMQGQSLSPEEEQKMADIQTIQKFVEIDNATQLSPFGLTQLTTQLEPGSVSIFFRNDHFSTLYKHPQSHQLYTLVTDAGYANHAEVVWESVVDVTGFNSEFLSGDFRAVSHGPSGSAGPTNPSPAGPHASSTATTSATAVSEVPEVRLSSQEQSDADYAYALSLQYQEEAQRERTNNAQEQPPTRRPSVPVRTRGSAPRMTNPPTRNSSIATTGPRLNQSHSEMDPDDPNAPPPPYEQAASGPRYSPPVRRRLPPDSHPNPQNSPNRHAREHIPNRPISNRQSTDRGRNSKDCNVM